MSINLVKFSSYALFHFIHFSWREIKMFCYYYMVFGYFNKINTSLGNTQLLVTHKLTLSPTVVLTS